MLQANPNGFKVLKKEEPVTVAEVPATVAEAAKAAPKVQIQAPIKSPDSVRSVRDDPNVVSSLPCVD